MVDIKQGTLSAFEHYIGSSLTVCMEKGRHIIHHWQ